MSEIAADWINEVPENEFISAAPTYNVGTYFDLFEEDMYSAENTANGIAMKYYFYDPTLHGYPKDERYPILIFLHGASNSLVGKTCINYCGGELFASPAYQNDFKGSYILVPIANEYIDEEGILQGCWTEEHAASLYGLIEEFIHKHTSGVGKKFLLGNSAGASMTFVMGRQYTDYFDALIPVGSSAIPDDAALDRIEKCGVSLFFAFGKRDEFHSYTKEVEPRIDKLKRMEHCFLYTPDWVRQGDGGIASIVAGREMGQHCLMNAIQANLLFDDGTPMDERLPGGFSSWIDKVNRNG